MISLLSLQPAAQIVDSGVYGSAMDASSLFPYVPSNADLERQAVERYLQGVQDVRYLAAGESAQVTVYPAERGMSIEAAARSDADIIRRRGEMPGEIVGKDLREEAIQLDESDIGEHLL